MKLYVGDAKTYQVWVHDLDGKINELVGGRPFSWGSGGAGAYELAGCILTDALGHEPEPLLRQAFKQDFLMSRSIDQSWDVALADIETWVEEQGEEEEEDFDTLDQDRRYPDEGDF